MLFSVITSVELTSLRLIARGKVQDLYQINKSILLFITTDCISAYNIIIANGVSYKGAIGYPDPADRALDLSADCPDPRAENPLDHLDSATWFDPC